MDQPMEMASAPMERLRHLREKLSEDRRIELDIPGYGGLLIARYRPLDWNTVKKITDRAQKAKGASAKNRELNSAIDVIIASCEEVLYRDEESGDARSFDPPCRYDEDLANVFGFSATTARQVVLEIFKNDLAVLGHHGDLYEWLTGQAGEIEEEALGK